jgi:hypothetical protein
VRLQTGNTGVLVETLGANSSWAALKAGFISAFSCIFVSELGDKTFFIAALLAMRRGRALVLAGATAALSVMTIISVAIGLVFHKVSFGCECGGGMRRFVALCSSARVD